jgi:hypothetical protein
MARSGCFCWPRPRLCIGRVFVWAKQDLVELLADRLRASARHQVSRPSFDLRLDLFFLFDRGQGLLHDFGRGLAVSAFARAAEIMRRLVQAHQGSDLLHRGGRAAEIVLRQIGKTELFVRGELVGQLQLNARAQSRRLAEQSSGCGFFEFEQHLRRLDFDPLARVQLDLRGSLGFGHDPPGHEFAGFFK